MCTARPNWLSLSTTFFNKAECHKVTTCQELTQTTTNLNIPA